ncbi:MAG TPA: glycosyltransferase family 2 protein [Armatimonadota bacterium]|jgi:cellulose synthase/poly-beta-1,6-N-acetylglucosamine synthase-like glycosyltransferase
MQQPLVSILVPMRNEEDFIESCLASLRAQDYPADRLEILVLDGASTDRSGEIVTAIAREDPRVRLLPNPKRLQAAAMNLGTQHAAGEIIVRADAHAVYGPSYVSTCVGHLLAGRAENVGGLQRAEGTTYFGRALAAALNSRFGSGNAAYRVATEERYVDTVWLGAWKRQTLLDLGGFDESMAANEDYELNCRLRKQGGRILLDPSLPSRYFPRATLGRLWRQYFRYGQAKVRTLQLHPGSLVLRQLIPPLFVALVIMSLIALPWTYLPLLAITALYALALIAGSVAAIAKAGGSLFPLLPPIYATIHFAWGLGFWWGMLRYRGFPLAGKSVKSSTLPSKTPPDKSGG